MEVLLFAMLTLKECQHWRFQFHISAFHQISACELENILADYSVILLHWLICVCSIVDSCFLFELIDADVLTSHRRFCLRWWHWWSLCIAHCWELFFVCVCVCVREIERSLFSIRQFSVKYAQHHGRYQRDHKVDLADHCYNIIAKSFLYIIGCIQRPFLSREWILPGPGLGRNGWNFECIPHMVLELTACFEPTFFHILYAFDGLH